jgi:hypothetical protein
MRRAPSTGQRERSLPSPGPIGFRVRDATGRSSAFELDSNTGTALVFGSASPFRVCAPGVLPAHFVVLPHDGTLVAASASAANAALLNGAALPTSWTALEIPSRIRLGSAVVEFFYMNDSGIVLVDRDLHRVRPLGPLPPPSPPPRRLQAPGSRLQSEKTRQDSRAATAPANVSSPIRLEPGAWSLEPAAARAHALWSAVPMSTRVLLGVIALLLFFLLFRGPRPA